MSSGLSTTRPGVSSSMSSRPGTVRPCSRSAPCSPHDTASARPARRSRSTSRCSRTPAWSRPSAVAAPSSTTSTTHRSPPSPSDGPSSPSEGRTMRIDLTNVYVDDQRAALAFYTDVLGFTTRHDVPIGEDFWITVVSPDAPDGPELLLEPAGHPAVKPYRDALVEDGIPLAQFAVDDVKPSTTGSPREGSRSPSRRPTSARRSLRSSTTRAATSSRSSPTSRRPPDASRRYWSPWAALTRGGAPEVSV